MILIYDDVQIPKRCKGCIGARKNGTVKVVEPSVENGRLQKVRKSRTVPIGFQMEEPEAEEEVLYEPPKIIDTLEEEVISYEEMERIL